MTLSPRKRRHRRRLEATLERIRQYTVTGPEPEPARPPARLTSPDNRNHSKRAA